MEGGVGGRGSGSRDIGRILFDGFSPAAAKQVSAQRWRKRSS